MTTIKLKRSSSTGVTPGTSDLELGELAVNTFDGKLFLKKNDGSDSIVEFVPAEDLSTSIVFNDSEDFSRSALLIDYNVSGDTPVLTGDILKRGLFIDVDSSANMGTVDNEHRLYGAVIDVRNTGDSDVVNGLRVFQENNHTAGTTTISRGVASEISNQASGTGTVTDIYGFYGITNQSSVNAVNEIAGLKLQTNAISTGTGGGTTIAGADIEVQRNGGAYTNAYGIKVLLDENNNNSDAPAVTNSYLIHASYEGPTMATNEWGLYLPDTGATNFFGGPVQLDGPVQITDTTAATQTGEGALQVTGGASFDSWVFFDIAGSNVVYDADTSDRQVFDIRRNNANQWLLTLQSDGDLVFDKNSTNNAAGRVVIDSVLLVEGIEIGRAGGTTSVTNIAIGPPSGVGRPLEQFTSANNIAIGYEASENNVNGYECVAIGRGALQDNVAGQRNTALGHQALRDNGTGGGNAFGNTAIGWQASLSNTTGNNNVSLGYAALTAATTASNNTAIGYRSLDTAGIGNDNTAVGYNSLTTLASGAQNVVVGSGAGTTLTGGSNNTVLGYNAEPSSATASNEITLGDGNVTSFRVPGLDFEINTNGRVGISTDTPTAPLHVNDNDGIRVGTGAFDLRLKGNQTPAVAVGGSTAAGIITTSGTSSGSAHVGVEIPANDSDDGFYVITDSNLDGTPDTVALKINAAGNIGMGTTDPDGKLDIATASNKVDLRLTNTTAEAAATTQYNVNLQSKYAEEAFTLYAGDTYRNQAWIGFDYFGQDLTFGSGPVGSSSERMRIDRFGDVGIGTSELTDDYKVIIEGSDQETANLSNGGTHGATLFLRATGEGVGSGGAVAFGTTNGNKRPFAAIKGLILDGTDNSVGDLAFSTRATTSATTLTERMRLKQNGRLGLGTNDPAGKFHSVGESQYGEAARFANNGDAVSWARADWVNDQASGSGIIYRDQAGSFVMRNDNSSGSSMDTVIQAGDSTSGVTKFLRNTTNESMRIDTSGHLIVPEGVTLGTSVGTYSAAKTIEDYEEGTWIPSYFMSTTDFTSITMDTLSATYTKIGDIVMIQGWIRTDAVDATGAAGQLRISGLPFTISGYGAISIGRSEGWTNNIWHCQLVGGETAIRLYKRTSLSGQDNIMTDADMITGTSANRNNLVFAGQYRTTA